MNLRCYGIETPSYIFLIMTTNDDSSSSAKKLAWNRILANVRSLEWRERMKYLFPKPEFEEMYNFSPLHKVVLGLEKQSIESCLDVNNRIDDVDATGRTALSWAVHRGDQEITRRLLMLGSDPNKATMTGFAPLHFAAQRSVECTEMLIIAGANLNARTLRSGAMAVHLALQSPLPGCDIIKIIKVLMQAGADINAAALNGETALHVAFRFNHPELIRCITRHGED